MKLDALDHPKTLDFASRLNISRPTAIGHLELLWAFTGKMAPQGNLGKWPDGAIARACDWMGDPKAFLEALLEARLLDADDAHRLLVHDWHVHAAGWVRAKLKNAHLRFLTGVSTSEAAEDLTRDPTRVATIQGKGREGKSQSERGAAPEPGTGGVAGPEGEGLFPPSPPPTRAHAFRGTRLPEDFLLTTERRAVAQAEGVEPTRTFAKFCDYWRGVSGTKGTKLDWDATWRNWCRSEGERNPRKPGGADNGLPTLNVG